MTNLTERAITVTGWTNPYANREWKQSELNRRNNATGFYREFAVITTHPEEGHTIVMDNQTALTARLYWTKTAIICEAFVFNYKLRRSQTGIGKTKGCGYEKASEAIQRALNDMGFEFSRPFGGQGISGAKDAMLAAVSYMMDKPKDDFFIHTANA